MSRLAWSSLCITASALLITPFARAQDGAVQEKSAQTADAVIKEHTDAYQKWLSDYRAAAPADRSKIIGERPLPNAVFGRLWKIIEADPKSDSTVTACSWIVSQGAASGPDLDKVIEVLASYHVTNSAIGPVCSALARVPSSAAVKFLARVEAKNQDPKVKALACFNLAQALKSQAGLARSLETADEQRQDVLVTRYGRSTVDQLKNAKAADLEKAAEANYDKILKTASYGEVTLGRRQLKTAAKSNLFEMRNLGIGKVAPEIDGEDVDGNPMKLSDYRGKVVVIDFWGDW